MNLRSAHLFAALSDEQIKRILDTSQTITLSDGQLLFESGDDAERFFLILGGQMKLYRLSASGDEKIIDIIQPGNTFAEALMFMEHPTYPVSASALGPAKVISFENRRFLDTLRDSVDTCFGIMGTMSQRLRGLIKEIDDLTLQSATTRICGMLLKRMREKNSAHFTLLAAKGVLAARLSMKAETFSRIFQNLASKGVIKTKGNEVTVLDPKALEELAHIESFIGLEPEEPFHNPCTLTGPKDL